ncbi:hypothetical protein [Kitasatospora sp. NPDC050463]|uniref:hypothetical protein n=1 Tax=Kitasatospora sp. NPDC050463 TaxID=3155786 RepID=UPI0033C81AD5
MTSTRPHSATPPHRRPLTGNGNASANGSASGTGALPGAVVAGPGLLEHPGPLDLFGPWSVRGVPASRGRAALEVYEHGELLDVVVAARLAPQVLRGARRCPTPGTWGSFGLAWGRLPQDGPAPVVAFTAGRLRRAGRAAAVVERPDVLTVAGEFWLAWAQGPFDGVLVEHHAGRERQPLERVRRYGRRAR